MYVNWAALSSVQKRDFIQAIVDKAIFSNKQLIIYLDVSPNSVRPFITDVYVNQSSLTITENNNLIVKVFATAWRYREMYEKCGDVDTIIKSEHVAARFVYKHLALAYLNPAIANKILNGKLNMPVRDILDKASRTYDFNKQAKLFTIPA